MQSFTQNISAHTHCMQSHSHMHKISFYFQTLLVCCRGLYTHISPTFIHAKAVAHSNTHCMHFCIACPSRLVWELVLIISWHSRPAAYIANDLLSHTHATHILYISRGWLQCERDSLKCVFVYFPFSHRQSAGYPKRGEQRFQRVAADIFVRIYDARMRTSTPT